MIFRCFGALSTMRRYESSPKVKQIIPGFLKIQTAKRPNSWSVLPQTLHHPKHLLPELFQSRIPRAHQQQDRIGR